MNATEGDDKMHNRCVSLFHNDQHSATKNLVLRDALMLRK